MVHFEDRILALLPVCWTKLGYYEDDSPNALWIDCSPSQQDVINFTWFVVILDLVLVVADVVLLRYLWYNHIDGAGLWNSFFPPTMYSNGQTFRSSKVPPFAVSQKRDPPTVISSIFVGLGFCFFGLLTLFLIKRNTDILHFEMETLIKYFQALAIFALLWAVFVSIVYVLYKNRWRLFNIALGFWATVFPPFAVWVKCGCCSGHLIICFALILMGYLPGVIYAWHIIITTEGRKGPRDLKGQNPVRKIKESDLDEDGRRMYLVSWKGYGDDQDTWEYAGNIDREALRAYKKSVAEQSAIDDDFPGMAQARRRSNSRRRSSTLRASSARRSSSAKAPLFTQGHPFA